MEELIRRLGEAAEWGVQRDLDLCNDPGSPYVADVGVHVQIAELVAEARATIKE